MRIDVRADVREIEKSLGKLKSGHDRAVTRALNHAIRKARTVAVREISRDLKVKQKTVRQRMRMRTANRTRWAADIEAFGGRIPLIDLNARKAPSGIAYRSGGGRKTIPHAFIARMSSGHRGVFKRRGRARLPIVELFGPSIPKVFLQDRIEQAIDRQARAEFEKEFRRQIELNIREAGA